MKELVASIFNEVVFSIENQHDIIQRAQISERMTPAAADCVSIDNAGIKIGHPMADPIARCLSGAADPTTAEMESSGTLQSGAD